MTLLDIFGFLRRAPKATPAEPEQPTAKRLDPEDPLEVTARANAWNPDAPEQNEVKLKPIKDFQIYRPSPALAKARGMDAAENWENGIDRQALDSAAGCSQINARGSFTNDEQGVLPPALFNWYMSQGFIGYQACAIVAQNWLVDKACSQAGEDACRNGWELKVGGKEVDKEIMDRIREKDIDYGIERNLTELTRFTNIFGIRVAIFKVKSDDPLYYEKPFNIDGVAPGSYQGISQIDPYWMTPLLTNDSTSDPSSIHFYDPEYWVISGKKYHRSHLIISRGPQPADILKPTYIFGGVSLVQRILERVYAAERVANEAPLLALNKRTTAIHVDVAKAITNEAEFAKKIQFWAKYRDNHAIKVLGINETIDQFDTSLADLDAVIMNQYQIVAAIAKTPATKLLGTSPKGFNATGEFETVSYHEHLESIQRHEHQPMLNRHYEIMLKSEEIDLNIQAIFNPVGSTSAIEQANLNKTKAETDAANVTTGAVSPEEVRDRLKQDRKSGYNLSDDIEAETTPGMSPEALAELEKAEGTAEKFNAQASAINENGAPAAPNGMGEETGVPANESESTDADDGGRSEVVGMLSSIMERFAQLEARLTPEGQDLARDDAPAVTRSIQPSVTGLNHSVKGSGAVVGPKADGQLQRIKLDGIVCAIENPRGSIRKAKTGDSWEITMPHHYGYIRGSKGADGDEVDCFIGPNLKSKNVFIVDQLTKEGGFDEHKVMLGFDDVKSATEGYMKSYSEGWTGLGPVTQMTAQDFKAWLAKGDTTKPLGKV